MSVLLPPGQAGSCSVDRLTDLLSGAKKGDRDAAADLFGVCAPMIRRRVRGRLRQNMRRLMDSQDILSTVSRRLDMCVLEGRIHATTLPQFCSFLLGIADHAFLEKSRSFGRTRCGESGYAQLLKQQSAFTSPATPEEVGQAVRTLESSLNHDLVTMQLAGVNHKVIGQLLGMSASAARQRWRAVRIKLARTLKKQDTA